MFSDSAPNASVAVPSSNRKDAVKKKKANRLSKLKQCKLDARREQWLSQVRNKSGCNGAVDGHTEEPLIHVEKERGRSLAKLEVIPRSKEKDALSMNNYSDSESFASNSPTSRGSSVFGNYDSTVNFTASTSSSRSSTSSEIDPVILAAQYITSVASIGSGTSSGRSSSCNSSVLCTGNMSGDDEGDVDDDDDDCFDDWEAMADALATASDQHQDNKEIGGVQKHDLEENIVPQVDESHKPSENHITGKAEKGGLENRHAWKPGDAFRPQSLPNLPNQYSSKMMVCEWHKKVSLSPVATSCPICFEDFDYTDSSFLPCPCGFRICLFCHKRIIEEDGRCPGCRKHYEHKHI